MVNNINEIYLVDVENVGFININSKSKNYKVFYISSSNFKNVNSLPSNCEVINYKHDGCKDALDFILDTYLGYLIATYGKSVNYHIVSDDRGYENVCGFWLEQGYSVTCNSIGVRKLTPKQYQGYILIRDMSYNETKRCMNIFKSYLNTDNKNRNQFEVNLLHSLNKYGYSKNEISKIADYLCSNINLIKEELLNG